MAKLLVCVLFAGMFIHIGMLAASRRDQAGRRAEPEMVEPSAQRDNDRVLSMLKNPERIAQLAAQMGMQHPRRTPSAW